MDFASMSGIVTAGYDAGKGTFTADPTAFGTDGTAVRNLINNTLKLPTLALTGVTAAPTVDAANNRVTVLGKSTLLGFSAGAATTAVFFLPAGPGEPQLDVAVAVPAGGGWKFPTQYSQLAGTLFDDVVPSGSPPAEFTYCTVAHAAPGSNLPLAVGLNFTGGLQLGGAGVGYVGRLIGGLTASTVAGPVAPTTYGPNMNLALQLSPSLNNLFATMHLPVTLGLVSRFDSVGSAAGIQLQSTFDLGSNKNLTIGVLLDDQPRGMVVIRGDFTNVSIPGPSDLINWVGGGLGSDVKSLLPGPYTSGTGIQLSYLELGVGTADMSLAYVGLGLAALTKSDWVLVPNFLTLTNVTGEVTVDTPFTAATRAVSVAVYGQLNVPVNKPILQMEAFANYPSYTVGATLVEGTTFNLTDMIGLLIPAVKDAPAFVLDELSLTVQFGGAKTQVSFAAGLNQPWGITFGGHEAVTLEAVSIELDNFSNDGGAGGTIAGAINVLGVETEFNYVLPGNFRIDAKIPEFPVSFENIIHDLGGVSWTPPAWLPTFTFPETELFIERSAGGGMTTYTFGMYAKPADIGVLALQIVYTGGSWQVAAGVDLTVSKFSALSSGLGGLAAFDSVFKLDALMLVIGSTAMTAFTFPDASKLSNPVLQTKTVKLPAQAGGLQAGVNFYAQMTFDDTQPDQKLVRQFLGFSANFTLGITLQVSIPSPTTNTRLFASISGTVGPVTLTGSFGGLMQSGELGLFLTAAVKTTIQSQPVEFDATMLFVENGAFLSGTMKGGPLKFGPVQLANVALEVGIDFEGVPSFGVAATIDVLTFDSSIAVFFDSSDPAKSMVAGAVSDLNLKDIVDALVGGPQVVPAAIDSVLATIGVEGTRAFTIPAATATALDNRDMNTVSAAFVAAGVSLPSATQSTLLIVNQPGKLWYVTDLSNATGPIHYELTNQGATIEVKLEAQFYLAPMATQIGTLQFPAGYRVDGKITIIGVSVEVHVNIQTTRGIAVDAAMTPLVLFSPSFLAVTGYGGKGGPSLSLSTYTQTALEQPTAALQAPHFVVSGQLTFLGVVVDAICVSVTTNGLVFALVGELIPGTTFNIYGSFTSLSQLSAGGGVSVGLNTTIDLGPLGKIVLNTHADGSVSASWDGTTADATLLASFTCQGQKFNIAQFHLDVTGNDLAHLATVLADKAEDLLKSFLKDAKQWLTWVANGVVTGISTAAADIGHVLSNTFGLGAQDIVNLTTQVLKYGLDDLLAALKGAGLAAQQAAQTLLDMGKGTIAEIAAALKDVFGGHADIPLHVDNVVQSHLDTGAAPGTNSHVDQRTGSHIDDTIKDWQGKPTSHNDNTNQLPHQDTHTDTAPTSHVDSATQHQDQSEHADNS